MAAATADRDGKRQEGALKSFKVKATQQIYKDTLVAVDSGGYLIPIAHGTASLKFVGVAFEKKLGGAADGDVSCRVRRKGEFEVVYNGGDATQALVGQEVFGVDDQSVDEDAVVTTNDYKVGSVTEFLSTTKLRIQIDNYVR